MINILVSTDYNYLEKVMTMLYSVRLHTREEIGVYFLNHSIGKQDMFHLNEYLEKECEMSLFEIDVSSTAMDSFVIGEDHFSCLEMYYRILAQFLIPESLERILWLDADIIVNKDIGELYYQDFDGMSYIVCKDAQDGLAVVQRKKRHLLLPEDEPYFNSGVLLMNLELLRKQTRMDEILKTCEWLQDRIECPDQDVLNYLYAKKVKYVDPIKYNHQVIDLKCVEENIDEIVILHYIGAEKPWNYWQINSASRFYWRVRIKQGFIKEAHEAYRKKAIDSFFVFLADLRQWISFIKNN